MLIRKRVQVEGRNLFLYASSQRQLFIAGLNAHLVKAIRCIADKPEFHAGGSQFL